MSPSDVEVVVEAGDRFDNLDSPAPVRPGSSRRFLQWLMRRKIRDGSENGVRLITSQLTVLEKLRNESGLEFGITCRLFATDDLERTANQFETYYELDCVVPLYMTFGLG